MLNAVQPESFEMGSSALKQRGSMRRGMPGASRSKGYESVSFRSIDPERRPARSMSPQKDYSKLAMQASKRMKFSKDKVRTGRLICLHLRSLLQESPVAQQSVRGKPPVKSSVDQRTKTLQQKQVPLPL